MALHDAINLYAIPQEAAGFEATNSIDLTTRKDRVDATGEDGEYASFSYLNEHGEFTASGHTLGGAAPAGVNFGQALAALGGIGAPAGIVFVQEITLEESNEDFQKWSVKGNFWAGIN